MGFELLENGPQEFGMVEEHIDNIEGIDRWQLEDGVTVLSGDIGMDYGSRKLMVELHDNIGKDYMSKEWLSVQGLEVMEQVPQAKELANKKLLCRLFVCWDEGRAGAEVELG